MKPVPLVFCDDESFKATGALTVLAGDIRSEAALMRQLPVPVEDDDYVIVVSRHLCPGGGTLSDSEFHVLVNHELGHAVHRHIHLRDRLKHQGEWQSGFEIEMEIQADSFAASRLSPEVVIAGLKRIHEVLSAIDGGERAYLADRYAALQALRNQNDRPAT
ncbi:hypothetical protein D9M68_358890 [compost metagenome]